MFHSQNDPAVISKFKGNTSNNKDNQQQFGFPILSTEILASWYCYFQVYPNPNKARTRLGFHQCWTLVPILENSFTCWFSSNEVGLLPLLAED